MKECIERGYLERRHLVGIRATVVIQEMSNEGILRDGILRGGVLKECIERGYLVGIRASDTRNVK